MSPEPTEPTVAPSRPNTSASFSACATRSCSVAVNAPVHTTSITGDEIGDGNGSALASADEDLHGERAGGAARAAEFEANIDKAGGIAGNPLPRPER